MRTFRLATTVAAAVVLVTGASLAHLRAQQYANRAAANAVETLNLKLRDGSVSLAFDGRSGYQRSALEALGLPIESQMLVFSRSSLQARLINPQNPRAIFYNDTIQLGFVRGGEILEVTVQDAEQGVLFYTLNQHVNGVPQFKETTICLACHKTPDTLGIPGLLTLNTLPQKEPRLFAGGTVPDHRSPFEERWGGWYVTGSSGTARHRGNQAPTVAARARRELTSVEGLFDTEGYVSTQSDVAALMVFLHQTRMTNLISRIGWEARDAAERARTLVTAPGEKLAADRIRDITVEFVDYLLFVDELRLTGGVRSLSGFIDTFSAKGPRDSKGRSLHELELTRRLMRYPCSYLIYSEAFDALPPLAKDAIYARMWRILSGQEKERRYIAALSAGDRRAIVEILKDTKKELPNYFSPSNVL